MSCDFCPEEFYNIDDWICHTLLKHTELQINGEDIPESGNVELNHNHIMFDKLFYTLRHYKDKDIGR